MSDWNFLNHHRISAKRPSDVPDRYWSTPDDGENGMFIFFTNNPPIRVRCVCSDGEGWKHVSVSIVNDNRTPRWETMCEVKDLFFEPEDVVVQFHPKKSEYVNHHPGCLHLWMPIGVKLPTPHHRLVGPR